MLNESKRFHPCRSFWSLWALECQWHHYTSRIMIFK